MMKGKRIRLMAVLLFAVLSVLPGAQRVYADDPSDESVDAAEYEEYHEIPQTGTVLKDASGTKYVISDSDIDSPCVFYKKASKKASGKVVIPDNVTIDGITYEVEAIGERAFYKNKKVTKVVMGNNINRIWNEAFLGCTALKSVTMSKKSQS